MTQTRKEALTELLEKVEAGGSDALHGCGDVFGVMNGIKFHGAYNGSLDAAKALHEAVLPGYDYILTNSGEHAGAVSGPLVAVADRAALERGEEPFEASAETIARAWLIAILNALIEQEPDQ